MQHCDYCGKDNDAVATFCAGCGTPFPPPPVTDLQTLTGDAPTAVELPSLNASRATIILLIYLTAQFITSIIVGAVAVSLALVGGRQLQDKEALAEFTKAITPIAVPFTVLGGGLATVLASFLLVRSRLKDGSPSGAAWVLGSTKEVCRGFSLGLAAGVIYVAFGAIAASLGFPHQKLGPMANMAVTPGLPRALWLISMLLIAPPFEELLFRGILYGGYRHSLGPAKAAVITSVIFTLLHITEWIYFLPALVGIAGMAIVALWMRLRSGAIGPAIAAHFGYNATLAFILTLFIAVSASK